MVLKLLHNLSSSSWHVFNGCTQGDGKVYISCINGNSIKWWMGGNIGTYGRNRAMGYDSFYSYPGLRWPHTSSGEEVLSLIPCERNLLAVSFQFTRKMCKTSPITKHTIPRSELLESPGM